MNTKPKNEVKGVVSAIRFSIPEDRAIEKYLKKRSAFHKKRITRTNLVRYCMHKVRPDLIKRP